MSNHRQYNEVNGWTPEEVNQSKKKSGKKKWIIGGAVVLGLAVIGFSVPAQDTDTAKAPETSTQAPQDDVQAAAAPEPTQEGQEPQSEPQEKSGHTLRFEATTSDGSSASVTYIGSGFDIVQHQDEPMPWSVDIDGIENPIDAVGANVNVMQNGSGDVTCRALWDGEVVSENTSTGMFATASCTLPVSL